MPKFLEDLAKKLEGKPGIREPWAVATAVAKKAGKLKGKGKKPGPKKRYDSFESAVGPMPKD